MRSDELHACWDVWRMWLHEVNLSREISRLKAISHVANPEMNESFCRWSPFIQCHYCMSAILGVLESVSVWWKRTSISRIESAYHVRKVQRVSHIHKVQRLSHICGEHHDSLLHMNTMCSWLTSQPSYKLQDKLCNRLALRQWVSYPFLIRKQQFQGVTFIPEPLGCTTQKPLLWRCVFLSLLDKLSSWCFEKEVLEGGDQDWTCQDLFLKDLMDKHQR